MISSVLEHFAGVKVEGVPPRQPTAFRSGSNELALARHGLRPAWPDRDARLSLVELPAVDRECVDDHDIERDQERRPDGAAPRKPKFTAALSPATTRPAMRAHRLAPHKIPIPATKANSPPSRCAQPHGARLLKACSSLVWTVW